MQIKHKTVIENDGEHVQACYFVRFKGDIWKHIGKTGVFDKRCRCSHDCCGCYNGGVSGVVRDGRNRYRIYVSYARNV